MTGTQIYNTCWLAVWLMFFCACTYGVIAGNPLHLIFVAGSIYFSYLLITDDEDGESLKQYAIRKYKAHKGAK